MKNILYISTILCYSFFNSQVGINTSNPVGKLHIDGEKDNPTTGSSSAVQTSNDVIITNNGNLGTGTVNPAVKLEINNGSANGALKIVDNTQANGKILVSDAEGVGTWKLPNTIKKLQVGNFAKNGTEGIVTSSNGSGYIYSNVSITLTKGTWILNLGLTLKSYLTKGKGRWAHLKLSSSNSSISYTGWQNLGTAANNTSYAGALLGSAVYNTNSSGTTAYFDANANNYLSGSNIIEVTQDTLTLYLHIENFTNENINYSNLTHYYSTLNSELANAGKVWVFNTGNWENYFYANPL